MLQLMFVILLLGATRAVLITCWRSRHMQEHVLSSEKSEYVFGPVLMTLHHFTYASGQWYVDANGRNRKEQERGCNQIHVWVCECGVDRGAHIVVVFGSYVINQVQTTRLVQ